jgi:uncharacterized OB-fold protein
MQVGTVVVMSSEGAMPDRKTRWSEMKAADLPGTALKSAEDVPHIAYTPDLRYAWDNGYALTTYLDGFKNGVIRGSRCSKCGRVMIPARSFCEICNLAPVSEYYDLPDTGTVQTYTISHVNWDSSPLPDGKVNIFAVIAIDGAAPEMGLVHKLGGVKPGDVKIGMKVKAAWRPAAERTGTVLDCMHFRPMKKGEDADIRPRPVKPVEADAAHLKTFPGRIPMSYIYTAGLAGSKFYADLAKGRLTGTWCPHCEAVHIPPSSFCEHGMIALDEVKDAKAVDPKSGVVAAFTVVYEDRSGKLLDEPQVVVQVVFPGTVGSLFGRLDVKTGDSVEVGMEVVLARIGKQSGPEFIVFRPI